MAIFEPAAEVGAREIPSSSLTIDVSLSLPDLTPSVIKLCKDLFPQWSKLDNVHFSVETVSGGITNLLLKVSVKEEDENQTCVTVRLYGPNTNYVVDRKREVQAIKALSAAGFGAELLGVFENGMVQSFINARTLTPADMRRPNLAAEIARQLRAFHQVEVPGSKEPQLWNDIFKFYGTASVLRFDDVESQKKYETISFVQVLADVLEIKDLTDLLHSPVVFAHNDLLSGNLMLNAELERLYFIDFEYGSYSYRGYDIGNHFNEYAGYDCDYNLCPSVEEQYHFFKHYLQPERPCEVSQADLEALCVEANVFMLASHLFWALWALIQARMSPVDFDYMGYFFLRYNEFKRQKDSSCSMARAYISKHDLD